MEYIISEKKIIKDIYKNIKRTKAKENIKMADINTSTSIIILNLHQ